MQNQQSEITKPKRRKLSLPAKPISVQIESRWPELFTKPMKIGITKDIERILRIPECDVKALIAKRVDCIEYQTLLITQRSRFNLDGKRVGWVSAVQREQAKTRLAEIKKQNQD